MTIFEWDERKDRANREKHKIFFTTARAAFLDPYCVIAADEDHSRDELRYYCFAASETAS